jgi:hypothetical protein
MGFAPLGAGANVPGLFEEGYTLVDIVLVPGTHSTAGWGAIWAVNPDWATASLLQ